MNVIEQRICIEDDRTTKEREVQKIFTAKANERREKLEQLK